MKFFYLSIGLCMFLIGCQSKSKKTAQPSSQPDYINYTAAIMQAESFILDSNYADALKKYKQAFKMVDKPLQNKVVASYFLWQ